MGIFFLSIGVGVIVSLLSLGVLHLLVNFMFKIPDDEEKKQQDGKK